jgi:hypothetical protein
MHPMLGGEVVEGEKCLTDLHQALDGLFVLNAVGFDCSHPDVLQCALGLCLQALRKRQRLRSARREENSAKDQRILTLEERLMPNPLIALGLAPFSREVWTSFTTRNSTITWTHPWIGGIYFARGQSG